MLRSWWWLLLLSLLSMCSDLFWFWVRVQLSFMSEFATTFINCGRLLSFCFRSYRDCLFAFGDDLVVRNLHGFLNIYELPVGVDYFLTFFIGVFMINAFNLCDGIDGLAAMLGIVISVCYGSIFYIIGDYLFLSFCVILIGCLFAFLRFNIPHKNKVFMGDTGSLFLGFFFICLPCIL